MLVLFKLALLIVMFLGAMREIRTKSWSYIGRSLLLVALFVAYGIFGFWILFGKTFGIPEASGEAGVVILGFFAWLAVGVAGLIVASPKK